MSAVYPAFPTDDEARRPAVGVILQTKYGNYYCFNLFV